MRRVLSEPWRVSHLIPNVAALAISIVSVAVASISLGWNVYRDVVMKPRLRVRCMIVSLMTPGQKSAPQLVQVSGTNFGPGELTVDSIEGKNAPIWRRLLRRAEYFVVMHVRTVPLGDTLPKRLAVGEKVTLYFPYDNRSFLGAPSTHIGFGDSFSRTHWAPRAQLRRAQSQNKHDFPTNPDTDATS